MYVGKAVDVRNDDITFTFMEECGKVEGCYKWPSPPDELKIYPFQTLLKLLMNLYLLERASVSLRFSKMQVVVCVVIIL